MRLFRPTKVDTSQNGIVKALEEAQVRVWIIGQPCDLLCQFYCARHGIWCWQTMECKTARGKAGRPRKRLDQEKQKEFIELTNTPIVTSFDEAWAVLNTRHYLGKRSA